MIRSVRIIACSLALAVGFGGLASAATEPVRSTQPAAKLTAQGSEKTTTMTIAGTGTCTAAADMITAGMTIAGMTTAAVASMPRAAGARTSARISADSRR